MTGNQTSLVPGSAAWYRARAEACRHNGESVSKYNHYLGIAEALDRSELEIGSLRDCLSKLVAFDDLMRDESWEEKGWAWMKTIPVTRNGRPVTHAELQAAVNGDPLPDPVNHPPHYTQHPSGIECIQITEHMGFNLGNAIKYVWRADLKADAFEDLRKAVWYIEREIERRRQAEANDA